MWIEIENQKDIEMFMSLFGEFHDSCIKEFRYLSGAFINEDLSMYPINNKRILKVIFQRQDRNPSVIEMEFIGLLRLSIYPEDENYTCEIVDATMIIVDNHIYWYDCGELNDLDNYKGAIICSSRVRWRVVDEYIGQKEIYVNSL